MYTQISLSTYTTTHMYTGVYQYIIHIYMCYLCLLYIFTLDYISGLHIRMCMCYLCFFMVKNHRKYIYNKTIHVYIDFRYRNIHMYIHVYIQKLLMCTYMIYHVFNDLQHLVLYIFNHFDYILGVYGALFCSFSLHIAGSRVHN